MIVYSKNRKYRARVAELYTSHYWGPLVIVEALEWAKPIPIYRTWVRTKVERYMMVVPSADEFEEMKAADGNAELMDAISSRNKCALCNMLRSALASHLWGVRREKRREKFMQIAMSHEECRK